MPSSRGSSPFQLLKPFLLMNSDAIRQEYPCHCVASDAQDQNSPAHVLPQASKANWSRSVLLPRRSVLTLHTTTTASIRLPSSRPRSTTSRQTCPSPLATRWCRVLAWRGSARHRTAHTLPWTPTCPSLRGPTCGTRTATWGWLVWRNTHDPHEPQMIMTYSLPFAQIFACLGRAIETAKEGLSHCNTCLSSWESKLVAIWQPKTLTAFLCGIETNLALAASASPFFSWHWVPGPPHPRF